MVLCSSVAEIIFGDYLCACVVGIVIAAANKPNGDNIGLCDGLSS